VDEIGISEAWANPGVTRAPLNRHERHVESFYVLEGEIALTAGDRELRVEAGSWAQVPPGIPLAISFPGPYPTRCLSLHTPS
jgi:uncharacterized cupin superfamily protein